MGTLRQVKRDIIGHLHSRTSYPSPGELFEEMEYYVPTTLKALHALVDDDVVAYENYKIILR